MRSIGLSDSLMYGGYQVTRALSIPIPRRVDDAPAFGVGKYTTASDMTSLWRALWLASGGIGPLQRVPPRAHGRRRALPALAHRPRTRSTEARHVRPARPRGRRPAQGRLDLGGATRHRARLLGGRCLRRGRHDVSLLRRLDLVRPARGARRRDRPAALPAHRGLIGDALDATLAAVGTVSEPTTAIVWPRKREP